MDLLVQYIPMIEINADAEFNCRGAIQPIDVHELASDIKHKGLIQPVTIADYIDTEQDQKKDGKPYRLVCGYRRFMAHIINEAETVAAINRGPMSEADARVMNLAENLKRENLSFMQEARALARLEELGISEHAAANQVGMSRGWVQVRFMALKLPEPIQLEIEAGFIKQTGVRDLFSIFKVAGYDATVEEAKRMKDFKLAKKNEPVRRSKKKPKSAKEVRNRSEIFAIQENVTDQLGCSLITRALAWAAGEISTNEFEDDVVKEFPKYGRNV